MLKDYIQFVYIVSVLNVNYRLSSFYFYAYNLFIYFEAPLS